MKLNHFITLFTLLMGCALFGQSCALVDETNDEETGIKTIGGIISSRDFFSLLIHKRIHPNDSIDYSLILHAASKVALPDSLINSKGVFELHLANNEIVEIENAECENNPIGLRALGFYATITSRMAEELIENPIRKIVVFNILETEFSPRKQKRQQKILTCLKNGQNND